MNKDKFLYKKPYYILCSIIVLALFFRFTTFVGVAASDDMSYSNLVWQILHNSFLQDVTLYKTRLAFLYPVALFVKLFGYKEIVLILYPLLCSIGLIICSYSLGSLLYGSFVGLISAFIIATCTLCVSYSTVLMPDIPIALFISISVTLVLYPLVYIRRNQVFRFKKLFVFLAGIFLGIAYLIKIPAIIIFIYCIILLYEYPASFRFYMIILFISGFLVVISCESIYYFYETGHFLARYEVVLNKIFFKHQSISNHKHVANIMLGPPSRVSLWEYPKKMFVLICEDGLFYYFLLPSIILFVVKKPSFRWTLIGWIVLVFCCFEFGSLSFTHYIPLPHNSRYLSLLLVPSSIIIAFAIKEISCYNKYLYLSLLLIFAITSWTMAKINAMTLNKEARQTLLIERCIVSNHLNLVYVDNETNLLLKFWKRILGVDIPKIRVAINIYRRSNKLPELKDNEAIIINMPFIIRVCRAQRLPIPSFNHLFHLQLRVIKIYPPKYPIADNLLRSIYNVVTVFPFIPNSLKARVISSIRFYLSRLPAFIFVKDKSTIKRLVN